MVAIPESACHRWVRTQALEPDHPASLPCCVTAFPVPGDLREVTQSLCA